MTSLAESQAFLDQFDKCLPLCERGDAVTVINALHTLNTITHASISQAIELDPSRGKDFVCSFLIELELALELFLSPAKMLGTIDGGLPALYSFTSEQIIALSDTTSPSTKEKVQKFLKALGVEPSSEFEHRTISNTVKEFLKHQVEPSSSGSLPPQRARESRSISWADQCSVCSDDYDSDVPPLGFDDESDASSVCAEDSSEDEDDGEDVDRSAAAIFLWSAPVKIHEAADKKVEADGTHTRRLSRDSEDSDLSSVGAAAKKSTPRPAAVFFKTRRCKNWEQNGACPFGDKCIFAHGDDDLRPADPSALQAAVPGAVNPAIRKQVEEGGERWDRRPNQGRMNAGNYKTRLCKNWEAGGCAFGGECMFAHGSAELRKPVKTKLCRTFAATGKCPYGSDCSYAHGHEDMQA